MTMQNQDNGMSWLLERFDPVSLAELNEHSDMMSRIDNKYVITRDALERILPSLRDRFDILDIDGCRAFTYDTRYFDDAARRAYYEHHQGLRKGFKVRIRRYADTGPCYLEVKLKGRRGMTIKHRIDQDPGATGTLTDEARSFIHSTYAGHYGKPFGYDLRWVMDIRYRRTTLVAKAGGERLTIDSGLMFRSADRHRSAGDDVFILETKSRNGRGFADLRLREVHERPAKKCSKYCIGMAVLGEVSRFNLFLPTMRKLNLIASDASADIRDLRAA